MWRMMLKSFMRSLIAADDPTETQMSVIHKPLLSEQSPCNKGTSPRVSEDCGQSKARSAVECCTIPKPVITWKMVSFHTFSKDEKQKEKLVHFIRRNEDPIFQNMNLSIACSQHFTKSDSWELYIVERSFL